MSKRKNKKYGRSNRIIVSPQTLYNLHQLADVSGYSTLGKVVDKLVRDHMITLRGNLYDRGW